LKPSNLLYNNKGILKICDMGLARKFSTQPRGYTPLVVTLWYRYSFGKKRAPEILLGNDHYTAALDIWSVGCIFAELLAKSNIY
jgi:serine/threonine protein kinase